MDLKTFVAESLSGIIAGLRRAQSERAESAAPPAGERPSPGVLNPALNRTPPEATRLLSRNGEPVYEVSFDIAVTVSAGSNLNSGIKVLGLGVEGRMQAAQSSVSRIQFKVPVEWPR